MLESDIEDKIIAYAKSLGGRCEKLILATKRGFPDRTIFLPNGKVLFMEVKKPDGVVSPHQARWLKRLEKLNIPATAVWSFEEAKEFIDGQI